MSSKVVSSKPANFAKGGTTKMFGRQFANPQKPGGSAHDVAQGKQGVKAGGKDPIGAQHAGPQVPGGSAHKTAGDGGKWGKGGSGHMYGKMTANTMKSGQTGK